MEGFANINLSKVNLKNADLGSIRLNSAIFKGANLEGINFRFALLSGSDFSSANLQKAILSDGHFVSADFTYANLQKARCSGEGEGTFRNAYFRSADLQEAYFNDSSFVGADFQRANLTRSTFRLCYLNKSNLTFANMQQIALVGSFLKDAILKNADLQNAILRSVHEEANHGSDYTFINVLIGADLTEANLMGADLKDVDFSEAILKKANLIGAKNLGLVQLTKAKTLYQAKLDPELEQQILEKYPYLLEEPRE
jgi:uncharacterized protein YjbI with pentapeptide repeats